MSGYRITDSYRDQRKALAVQYLSTQDPNERSRIRQELSKLPPPPWLSRINWNFEPEPPRADEIALAELCPQPLVGVYEAEIVSGTARVILTRKGLLIGVLTLRATNERGETCERRLRFLLNPSSPKAEPLALEDLSTLLMWRRAVGAARARCFVELVEGLRVASLGKRVRFELRERRGWGGMPETCVKAFRTEDGDA
jgi:hypothetical protein